MTLSKPFSVAIPVLRKIIQAGHEAYFVGGSVRDYLLQRPIQDVDIATSALPQEVKDLFSSTIDVGIEHGTILVKYHSRTYEITTFRSESQYRDFRRPDKVHFIRSLKEDLKRRDFTMNSLAMDENGIIIDPFNGKEDMLNKQIHTVGEASDRFQEDALRMMRAVRFVSQLGFDLSATTTDALKEYGHLLRHIAVERIYAEMQKLLGGKNSSQSLVIIVQTGLFEFLPGMRGRKEELSKLSAYMTFLSSEESFWVLFLFLTKCKQPKECLSQWRMSNVKKNSIYQALSVLNERVRGPLNEHQLYLSGINTALTVEEIYGALENKAVDSNLLKVKYDKLPIKQRSDLAVKGTDLMALGDRSGGPWVKKLLTDIEKAVVERDIENEESSIKEWVKECNLLSEKK
ncbi:CCA tRNA nucleotidyltransferase [Bacillus sp. 2205SS5-2]|uniref:CCA tRNA nucleotidyltransferase n=1 Tax=Bacillus sp. 2205SS5-2 TaxID=3109031 RepID=UPI0030065ED2